ncbi:MAG TPA: PPC domain-containing protein [Terriglobia bacterium]|nr:PPC domain-containing protein [Terriglobia bacterium]
MTTKIRLLIALSSLALVFSVPLRAEEPIIPPTIDKVWPAGMERGTTVTFTLDGRNLADAKDVIFDAPGISGKVTDITDVPEKISGPRAGVDLGAQVPLGKKQTAKLEVTVAKDVEPGIHEFRIQTPLGTSNTAVLAIGSLPEIAESPKAEMSSSAEAQEVELPATLVGTVATPGDTDRYQFSGKAGEELVFQVVASELGSDLESLLFLQDASGHTLAEAGRDDNSADAVLTYKLPQEGKYTLAVTDREKGGGMDHFYRINAGALPYVKTMFPLGVPAGQSAEVAVSGVNLGGIREVRVEAPKAAEGWTTIPLAVKTSEGRSLDRLRLVVSNAPAILEHEPNDTAAEAQPISLPVAIDGHIDEPSKAGGAADEDFFRFHAHQGENITIGVAAARLGSPLDSVIEILDAQGNPIPRATVRCLNQTTTTLSDRDSRTAGIRLVSTSGLRENDYVMVGDELDQIAYIPDQPDADTSLKSIRGLREAFLGTSPDVHAVNTPVYKAEILPPDAQFPENGLPVFHLTWRNDDGGPGYGPDSRLDFVAPRDADYILHLKDVRGLQGPEFTYRVTLRDAMPSYQLEASTNNPNIPKGGSVPVTVSADRLEGYEGPIRIEVKGLPRGVTASAATIPEGQNSTVVVLSAGREASADAPPAPIQIIGHGSVNGRDLVRAADPDAKLQLASVIPPPDVVVSAEPTYVVIEPGKETTVTLRVARQNGFKGRVPCEVMNLPPGVRVVNVGLNGVLVTESQTSRTFTLKAEDWAKPIEQPIYVVGQVESNSSTLHASPPLRLRVENKQEVASTETAAKSGR